MYTVYHNPRCKKSRAGLQHVIDKNMEHRVREYLKELLTEAEFGRLLMKLNMKPFDLIRTQEEYCRMLLIDRLILKPQWKRILRNSLLNLNQKLIS